MAPICVRGSPGRSDAKGITKRTHRRACVGRRSGRRCDRDATRSAERPGGRRSRLPCGSAHPRSKPVLERRAWANFTVAYRCTMGSSTASPGPSMFDHRTRKDPFYFDRRTGAASRSPTLSAGAIRTGPRGGPDRHITRPCFPIPIGSVEATSPTTGQPLGPKMRARSRQLGRPPVKLRTRTRR